MPLPAAVGTVTIDFDIRHPMSGAPGTGTVEVTIPYALRDTTDNVILGPGTITAAVSSGVGTITIPDPHDSDVSPQGWAPHVKILTDVWADEFDVEIPPGSAGTTVHLASLAPSVSPPAVVTYALAADLLNYLPRAGGTITGPVTWNGTPSASGHLATKAYVDANAGGGSTPDATTTTKGKLQLAGDLGGTADAPTVPALATKYVKPGSGIPSSDLTAAVQTSLGKADTAVQPGSLATVATTGAYADLTGKPSIPDTYDDLTGTVPTSALPALAINDVFTVASQAAMLALTAQRGDIAIRTDLPATFILSTDSPGTLADWKQLQIPADAVLSVNGQVGVVVLAKGDIGLGNVSNLAPADLGISTATQSALDGKQPLDADLTAIAGLAPADGALLQRISGAWAALDPADLPVSTAQQTAINARIPASIVDAKGDLVAGSAADTVVRVPVGSNGQVLTADSTETAGVKWAAPAAGGASFEIVEARITSGDFTPPNTSGNWAKPGDANGLSTAFRLTITDAQVGDWVEIGLRGMRNDTTSALYDFAVQVGSSIVRYLSSGTSTPSIEGDPSMYPVSGFRPHAGVPAGFVVTSGDLDGGQVRFVLANKTAGAGTFYASANYPFWMVAKRWRQ
jgi:hypothetical protein